jgi:RNA polymerase sigma factor (sigma-70 family)
MFSGIQMEQHGQLSSDLRSTGVDDRTLWQRFRNGNDLAFSVIYSKYVQRLFNYGMHTCRDRELVMDCLQELFARLWDKRAQLADVEAVNYYLIKSYRRLLLGKLAQRRKYFFVRISKDEKGFDFNPSIEEVLILEEATSSQIEELRKAVATLTKRQREAIFLKFYNDLSYSEVASVMEMNIDSVYNLISKAIDSLRKNLKTSVFCIPGLFQYYDF